MAVIEIDAHPARKGEGCYMGQDKEAHARYILAIQLPAVDVPKVAESEAGFTVSG